MEVKNNYNECITNLACSVRKYFNLESKHNSLSYIDKILDEKKPRNVVVILFDGMGSNIIDRVLDKDDFFIKNRIKKITTVFPATTVAATTSITTGLNPVETGMLGWNTYCKDIDKVICTFLGFERDDETETVLDEAVLYKNKHMKTKTIVEEINEKNVDLAYSLMPLGDSPYNGIDDMFNKIKSICNEKTEKRKYIYAYDVDPDSLMHVLGSDSLEVSDAIKERNDKVEKLCEELDDTVVIVIADHGHINIENIYLEDYKDILECLSKKTSIESRAINFFIKEDKKEEFVKLFNKYFGYYYTLYTRDDVIKSKLFGTGEENEIFKDELGDYLAISYSNKNIVCPFDNVFLSHHAGYTDDEIFIPLIVIDKTK